MLVNNIFDMRYNRVNILSVVGVSVFHNITDIRAYSRHGLTVRPENKQSVMLQIKAFRNLVRGNYD